MSIAPGHNDPDDVSLARRLAMAWQFWPLPWGTICGRASLRPLLVDDIQDFYVPLVL